MRHGLDDMDAASDGPGGADAYGPVGEDLYRTRSGVSGISAVSSDASRHHRRGGRARRRVCGLSFERYNVVAVSVAFLAIFSAYNTVQNYITSLLPGHLGDESLSVLYITIALTVCSAPSVMGSLGERRTMILGAACYVVYLASLMYVVEWIVLVTSAVIGFGAALLWVAVGVFLTKHSTADDRGFTSGFFWSTFQLSGIVGNLGAYFVFKGVHASWTFFACFTACGVVGVLLLLMIRERDRTSLSDVVDLERTPLMHSGGGGGLRGGDGGHDGGGGDRAAPKSYGASESREAVTPGASYDGSEYTDGGTTQGRREYDDANDDDAEPLSCSEQATRIKARGVELLHRQDTLLLVPMFFFTGFELTFWTGEMPQLLPTASIGLVLTFTGVGEAFGGYVMGWFSDKLGRSGTLVLGAAVYAASLVGTVALKQGWGRGSLALIGGVEWTAYPIAFGFGVGDSVFNTQVYALLGTMFSEGSSAESFTLFQLLQNLGSAIGYYIAIPLPLHGPDGSMASVYMQAVALVVSTVCFVQSCAIVDARERAAAAPSAPGTAMTPHV